MKQIAWVYAQLKKGRTLTPILAMDGCGTMRLAAIIHTLRERGVNIRTTPMKSKNGATYAAYKMVKGTK
jgi:uncharacterized metal-binding protein